ncbi:MAG: pitrilysin family protein [Planctomycetota bacterium]
MAQPHMTQLDCGATLVVERIPGVRSASTTWLIPCGDAFDDTDRLGCAALLGEMLVRGAGSLDSRAQADAFDRVGATRGVENGRIFMRLTSTALGDRLDEAMRLVAQSVLEPRFDAGSLDSARDLCLQSLASLADEPQHRATLLARARHFAEPVNRSGYGTEDGLKAVTRDELADAWAAHARPKGSIIGVAGDVDTDKVTSTLNGLLGSWSGEAPWYQGGGAPPRGYAHEEDDSSQVQVLLVHESPDAGSADNPLERVLTAVLSGGMSGRLFTEVREKRGLCYSVNAGYAADKTFGTTTAYVGTTPERAQEAIDVLHGELVAIGRTKPVEREEFSRAVEGLKSRVVFSGESASARAGSTAGDIYRLGKPRSLEEIVAQIEAVTLEGLNDYAAGRDLGTFTVQTLGSASVNPPA